MKLKTYHKKRNFKKTPEPKGKVLSNPPSHLFVIQKHAASHLHYDFRLELNGVLLSWAVPKGPCLDPTVKRLAMHVEDHPLDYGSFEGIIPKGEYGGGTVMLWDTGQWFCEEPNPTEAYHKGALRFSLMGKKLKGLWKLFRMNKDDKTWLLVKIKDKYAKTLKNYDVTLKQANSVKSKKSIDQIAVNYKDVWRSDKLKKNTLPKNKVIKRKPNLIKIHLKPSPFPLSISPELATLVDQPPEGDIWLHEIKLDGYRLLAFKQKNVIRLMTRNKNDWTIKFPKLVQALKKLSSKNFILDGEVVVLDDNQKSNFQLLQNTIKEGKSAFVYYVFDLIYYDKYNLSSLSLLERKNILHSFLSENTGLIRYSDHVQGSGKEIFNNASRLGLEGIVSKDSSSTYLQKRSKDWLKVKCIKRQEFIIGGYNLPTTGKRKYFRSLMLGAYCGENLLIYHGNVGTGFTEKSLKEIYLLLKKYTSKKMPFNKRPLASKNSIWIKPVLIAEVEFTEWTNDGTLRHPSFKGLRNDKSAKKITKEKEFPTKNIVKKEKISNKNIKYELTHPEKILYQEDEITKQDVATYYEYVQKWILPYISNRPLTFVRCPSSYLECFYQKHINQKSAGLFQIVIKGKESKKEKYIYLKNIRGLMELPQLGILEIHPWNCKINNIEYPDMIIFDLDPAPDVLWKKVVAAAKQIKNYLEEYNLRSFVKTSGGKGLHIIVPFRPEYTWDEVKNFAHVFVNFLVMKHPKEYVGKMNKSLRTGKIFVDYLRNQKEATAVAPYSLRSRIHAPVSTPIAWNELTNNFKDTYFTLKTIPKRLEKIKDPWQDFFQVHQSLNLKKLK